MESSQRNGKRVVMPILKKGDKKDKRNYIPVICLTAASKVLEKKSYANRLQNTGSPINYYRIANMVSGEKDQP